MNKALVTLLALSIASTVFGEPKREKGISIHMLPDRVAKFEGKKGGFTVSYAPYIKPEKKEPILRTKEGSKSEWCMDCAHESIGLFGRRKGTLRSSIHFT